MTPPTIATVDFRDEVDAFRRGEDHHGLFSYRYARHSRFRRAVLSAGMNGQQPAVHHYGRRSFSDFGVDRNNFYGFVNRDFFKVQQDLGTLTPSSRSRPISCSPTRRGAHNRSTITSAPFRNRRSPPTLIRRTDPDRQSAEPLSGHRRSQTRRRQPTNSIPGFQTHAVGRRRISRETSSIDKYNGFSSEGDRQSLHRRRFFERDKRLQPAVYRYSVPAPRR